jgi:hypothetical protein
MDWTLIVMCIGCFASSVVHPLIQSVIFERNAKKHIATFQNADKLEDIITLPEGFIAFLQFTTREFSSGNSLTQILSFISLISFGQMEQRIFYFGITLSNSRNWQPIHPSQFLHQNYQTPQRMPIIMAAPHLNILQNHHHQQEALHQHQQEQAKEVAPCWVQHQRHSHSSLQQQHQSHHCLLLHLQQAQMLHHHHHHVHETFVQ